MKMKNSIRIFLLFIYSGVVLLLLFFLLKMFGGSVLFLFPATTKPFNGKKLFYEHFLQENQHTIMQNLTEK